MANTDTGMSLQDEALLIELLGDDAAILSSRLEQYNAEQELKEKHNQAAALIVTQPTETKKTVTAKTGNTDFDAYMMWLDGEIDFVRETLEAIYPGNIDVVKTNNFIGTDSEHIGTAWRACNGRIENISGGGATILGGRVACEAVIHFPEFVITNSKREKHTIRDLYIQLKFYGNMRFVDSFKGLRATKTYAEYSSSYGHSHMNTSPMPIGVSSFCLGSTEFKTLVANLIARPWNRLMFEMFAIQLSDYLKWESLEGGPHARIAEIRNRNGRNQWQAPGTPALNIYYKAFIKKNTSHPINIEDTGYGLKLTVAKDLEFWKRVTEVTDTHHRLPFNQLKMETFQEPDDESEFEAQAQRLNAEYARTPASLKFKGVHIQLKIFTKGSAQEKDRKDYMAHESVVNHIHSKLETKLNEHLQDEFSK